MDLINGVDQESVISQVTVGEILTVSGTYKGEVMTVTVDDASAVFGSVLYGAADFHYDRADADATSTLPVVVMALQSGAGSKLVLVKGQICNTSWDWSAGYIYLSTSTGALTQTAPSGSGDSVQIVGWALSADTMYFYPQLVTVELA